MQLNDDYRSEVERAMVYAMISGLENAQISSGDLPEISSQILDQLPAAGTHQQLMGFLEHMSKRWDIFVAVANTEMARIIEKQKEGIVRNMLTLSKQGQIDEALKVADTLKPTKQ
jgi:hypothetical protein